MAFFSEIFNRAGRVARGQVNSGMESLEDANFETTVRQTIADMKTELNKVVQSSAHGDEQLQSVGRRVSEVCPAIQGMERSRRSGPGCG